MTQLCRIIVYLTSLVFQSIPSNACVYWCQMSQPGKFNACGQDCSVWFDCTDQSSFSGYNFCSNYYDMSQANYLSLQFDESVGSCIVQSSTCPSGGNGILRLQPVSFPSAAVTTKTSHPVTVTTTGKSSVTTTAFIGTTVKPSSEATSPNPVATSAVMKATTIAADFNPTSTILPGTKLQEVLHSTTLTSQQEATSTSKVTAQPSTDKPSVANQSSTTTINILPKATDNGGLIVTWHYHARPNVNASAVVTGLPHVLACVRWCQSDPLCKGLSLEENHRPEHAQCFIYYDRWTELIYDQHFTTYTLK